MILQINSYGHEILKKKCSSLEYDFLEWQQVINDMWETLDHAHGCGLSAPQINLPVKLFIVNSLSVYQSLSDKDREHYFEGDQGIRETFINARIIHRSFEKWIDYEGCLSIPGITEKIERSWSVTIEYENQSFLKQVETFNGFTARIIQHEYDHMDGLLYLDHLKPVRRKILQEKLKRISSGLLPSAYPMKFPEKPNIPEIL